VSFAVVRLSVGGATVTRGIVAIATAGDDCTISGVGGAEMSTSGASAGTGELFFSISRTPKTAAIINTSTKSATPTRRGSSVAVADSGSINGSAPSKRMRILRAEAEVEESVMHANVSAFFSGPTVADFGEGFHAFLSSHNALNPVGLTIGV